MSAVSCGNEAVLGIPALTAYHAVTTGAGVVEKNVIIAGGSGAGGDYAVQIAKAHLVVVVDDNSRVYGHDNPVLTGSVFGATNGDVLAVTYSTQALPISRLGTYAISAGINDPRATVEL